MKVTIQIYSDSGIGPYQQEKVVDNCYLENEIWMKDGKSLESIYDTGSIEYECTILAVM